MVQWMRHRRPHYKGGVALEAERPSPSYIVDVGSSIQSDIHSPHDLASDACTCE